MSRILVVTGTDTGVGKTHMSCGLARLARKQWPGALALKPIESGAPGAVPGPTEDGVQLAEATGQAKPRAALIRLSAPIAPPDAADREGVSLDFDGLCDRVAALASDADWTLVEGAGGLLSPLTWHHSTLDLALRLKADVVVVAADVLGTQNHVLLT
ncbi:MAG: dethiobiotin synthetase, partial [Myxococcota bacterium]